MKGLKESGPDELDAVARRAIRDYAMGGITQAQCNYVTQRVDQLKSYIESLPEREETE